MVFSPIMLLVALIIKIESKGPVIYKSQRVGQ
ncbi:MAG: sugar transferase [Candidatus Peribacteria bacterium]|nr:sugar transferase [Candidatus Peribacteria bacterium]